MNVFALLSPVRLYPKCVSALMRFFQIKLESPNMVDSTSCNIKHSIAVVRNVTSPLLAWFDLVLCAHYT